MLNTLRYYVNVIMLTLKTKAEYGSVNSYMDCVSPFKQYAGIALSGQYAGAYTGIFIFISISALCHAVLLTDELDCAT